MFRHFTVCTGSHSAILHSLFHGLLRTLHELMRSKESNQAHISLSFFYVCLYFECICKSLCLCLLSCLWCGFLFERVSYPSLLLLSIPLSSCEYLSLLSFLYGVLFLVFISLTLILTAQIAIYTHTWKFLLSVRHCVCIDSLVLLLISFLSIIMFEWNFMFVVCVYAFIHYYASRYHPLCFSVLLLYLPPYSHPLLGR